MSIYAKHARVPLNVTQKEAVREHARIWYEKSQINKLKQTADQAYENLRYGYLWENSAFNKEAMIALSHQNLNQLEQEIRELTSKGEDDNIISRFLNQFSKLKLIAKTHTKNPEQLTVVKPLTKRSGKTQEEIILDPGSVSEITNADPIDIEALANNSFVFFKLQLDPKAYPFLRYYGSGMGRYAYIFPLESTGLLKLGHVYTIDPVFPEEGIVESKIFTNLLPSQEKSKWLRDVTADGMHHLYPLTDKTTPIQPLERIFYGPDIIKGLGLYMLVEAYKMNPEIYHFLINQKTLQEDKVIQVIDRLLICVLKIQGLLPGEISTHFTKLVDTRAAPEADSSKVGEKTQQHVH